MYVTHKKYLPMLICSSLLVAACSKERPPRSVQEFMDNPQFLEAAVVRCSVNRAESRYDAECVNARQAVGLIEAREERARRDRLEAESEAKRDALRRTQRAAAAARRAAAERARLREEAEYLAQFGEVPTPQDEGGGPDLEANVPGAVIPSPVQDDVPRSQPSPEESEVIFEEPVRDHIESVPASDGGNAPVVNNEPAADLDSIRDELKRRQEESTN
jgi:hypothetical protein